LLQFPDVIVSTDVTHGGADKDSESWGINQEMNTGMLLLRSSPGATATCMAWVDRMRKEMISIRKLPKNMLQWWSNDQTFFNEVIHRGAAAGTLKDDIVAQAGTSRAMSFMASTNHAAKQQKLQEAMASVLALRRGNPGAYAATRGVLFKYISREGQRIPMSLATFPFMYFASGHTFFTQSLQPRLGFLPVAVHTTFQFGDTAEFAWGKRERLRERQLWAVDSDDYFAMEGNYAAGKGAEEDGFRGFIQLVGQVDWTPEDFVRAEASSSIKLEGSRSFVDAVLARKAIDVHNMYRGNPNYHMQMDSFQRRLIHDGLALARAMKRKFIFPKLTCWVDRYWNNLEGGRFPGVSAQQHPSPFHCPFDHLFDLDKWVHSQVPMRHYAFLESDRITEAQRNDSVVVRVRWPGGGAADSAAAVGARELHVAPGTSFADIARQLQLRSWSDAYVIRIDARSLELLCEDLGSTSENQAFNEIMHRVLGIGEQIRFCDARANPTYNGRQDDPNHPINCTWGFHRPPQLPQGGTCVASKDEILQSRNKEIPRTFRGNTVMGSWNAWSTSDRAGYLYHHYM